MANVFFGLIMIMVGIGFSASSAEARRLQVQLRNYTSGQGMQNPMVAVGGPSVSVSVFNIGAKSSVGLDKLAEGGDCLSLTTLLINRGAVAVCNSVIVYGQAHIADLVIPAGDIFLTMLVKLTPTNDGFGGVQSLKISGSAVPGLWRGVTFGGFDAGGEYNDERCAHLNSPPACGFSGEGYSGVVEPNQENRVQYHPGLHGQGDLDPAINAFGAPVGIMYYRVVD